MATKDNSNKKKKSLIKSIQDFMSSYQGKVILNYAYSWGAAVVIMGALFKLTHLPGGNIMLFIGMGTEVLVFAVSAFDKPFKSYKWESVFPQIKLNGAPDVDLSGKSSTEAAQEAEAMVHEAEGEKLNAGELSAVINAAQVVAASASAAAASAQPSVQPQQGGGEMPSGGQQQPAYTGQPVTGGVAGPQFVGGVVGGPVIVGGSPVSGGGQAHADGNQSVAAGDAPQQITIVQSGQPAQPQQPEMDMEMAQSLSQASEEYLDKLKEMTESLDKFQKATASLSEMSDSLAQAYKIISDNSGNITAHSQGYVYQMENLNRNLSGLNTIYEIQLRSISSQLDTIKQVNEGLERIKDMYEGSQEDSEKFHKETELMAKQIEELNAVYARMLQAMTVNMKQS